jgi:hypothetical protein
MLGTLMLYQRHIVNAADGRVRVLFLEAWFRHAGLQVWISVPALNVRLRPLPVPMQTERGVNPDSAPLCASLEMNAAMVFSQVVKMPPASTCDVVPISAKGVRIGLDRSEVRSLCVNQIRAHEVIGQQSQQKTLKTSQVETSTTCGVLLRELCGNRFKRFEIVRDNFQHSSLEFIAVL